VYIDHSMSQGNHGFSIAPRWYWRISPPALFSHQKQSGWDDSDD
jgi:hypothetical protein